MAAPARTLDIPEAQVCVDYFDGPEFSWHHRVLVVAGPSAGDWVGFSPDLEVQVIKLSEHRVVALQRAVPFPARARGEVYACGAVSDAELERVRLEARALARVLGYPGVPAAVAGGGIPRWLVADPASDKCGEEVDLAIVGDVTKLVATPSR